MNLYLLTQEVVSGYDAYDSAVVCAPDEHTAKRIHPHVSDILNVSIYYDDEEECFMGCSRSGDARRYEPGKGRSWPNDLGYVYVRLLGEARPSVVPGVVCSSFNAG